MRRLFLTIFLFIPLISFADPASNLQAKLNGLSSMTADFQQVVHDENGAVLQTSTGKLAILRPGKFRWQVLKPTPQIIVTDGKQVWIYDPGLEQVTIRQLGNSVGQTPILLLTSPNINLAAQFTVKQQASSFLLSPKKPEQDFQSVNLTFSGKQLTDMKLVTGLGQYSELKFSDIKLNPHLSATDFSFIPPKGVDVVRE